MQQRQLRNAIQSRYGVSKKTSNQVIKGLAEIEKHRQGTAVGLPGRPGPSTQQSEQVPSIDTIIGGLFGSGASAQGGGILGLIITIIKRLFGLGGSQGGQDVTNILNDLTSGATHPNQAPDLASILLGLLGSSMTGSGGQTAGVEDLVTSLLGGQRTSQKPK